MCLRDSGVNYGPVVFEMEHLGAEGGGDGWAGAVGEQGEDFFTWGGRKGLFFVLASLPTAADRSPAGRLQKDSRLNAPAPVKKSLKITDGGHDRALLKGLAATWGEGERRHKEGRGRCGAGVVRGTATDGHGKHGQTRTDWTVGGW